MALKEVRTDGRWSGNLYRTLRRYLTANVGQPWAKIYSHICSVADSRSNLGRELRHAVDNEVDDLYNHTRRYPRNDWYVDEQGILRVYSKITWRQRHQEKLKKTLIEEIHFKDDDTSMWYQLIDIPDGPTASKYTKMHKAWFRVVVRTVRITFPASEWELARPHNLKKGKKGYYHESTKTVYDQTQCNHKLVTLLWAIAQRKNVRKILKLVEPSYDYKDEKKRGLIAYVEGSSREGKKHA